MPEFRGAESENGNNKFLLAMEEPAWTRKENQVTSEMKEKEEDQTPAEEK